MNRKIFKRFLILAGAAAILCGCTIAATPKESALAGSCAVDRTLLHEQLYATLWVQTSAEYQIMTTRSYRQATDNLKRLLADPTHTAALEQQGNFSTKPPAIIMDIDETILDNSPFQAQAIVDGQIFSPKAWTTWVNAASADWVPGARDFIEYARRQGATIFFVTNRADDEEQKTRDNFARLNLAVPASPDRVLTKNERTDWTSDKTSRRAYIAKDYRIVMLIGDDLNDFFPARDSVKKRQESALSLADHFGSDWFLLPNPLYGSWERALYDRNEDCDTLMQKRRHLHGYR